jgi:hypothetical protein
MNPLAWAASSIPGTPTVRSPKRCAARRPLLVSSVGDHISRLDFLFFAQNENGIQISEVLVL